mmetsp:Transcript_17385/g.41653  ORF Transcript_17385/g.41653 Transcript_17385/m.41653 type:complete len:254 (-) Transcript_17385:3799-4560(-)
MLLEYMCGRGHFELHPRGLIARPSSTGTPDLHEAAHRRPRRFRHRRCLSLIPSLTCIGASPRRAAHHYLERPSELAQLCGRLRVRKASLPVDRENHVVCLDARACRVAVRVERRDNGEHHVRPPPLRHVEPFIVPHKPDAKPLVLRLLEDGDLPKRPRRRGGRRRGGGGRLLRARRLEQSSRRGGGGGRRRSQPLEEEGVLHRRLDHLLERPTRKCDAVDADDPVANLQPRRVARLQVALRVGGAARHHVDDH